MVEAMRRVVGRYLVHSVIASGGMASVHVGHMVGPGGFSRVVAIKRLHPHLARDPEFVAMLLDEARLAARIQHPNVVAPIDVINAEDEVLLVMEYVRGDSLAGLLMTCVRRGEPTPIPVVAAIVIGVLHGLQAAHEARSDAGKPLAIVHRDISPQNVLVGDDGVARVVDFGVAKGLARLQSTESGQLKGKLGYMAPEQLSGGNVDHRADLYAVGIVLWEALCGLRLRPGIDLGEIVGQLASSEVPPPSRHRPEVSAELDALVLRALSRAPDQRFGSAAEMAAELERITSPASQAAVGRWVRDVVPDVLSRQEAYLAELERTSARSIPTELPRHQDNNAPPIDQVPTEIRGDPAEGVGRAGITSQSSAPRTRRVGLVFVGLLALGAGAWASTRATTKSHPSTHGERSTAPLASPSSAQVLTAPAPSPPTAAVASAAAVPETASHSPAPPRLRPANLPPRSTAKPAPSSSSCDPPYDLDPTQKSPLGEPLKRFKPWCL